MTTQVSGTLGDQITYPKHIQKMSPEDEAKMAAALAKVALSYLPEQYGGWDQTMQWEEALSLGEQQRIGVARVLYHNPMFVVLDECMSFFCFFLFLLFASWCGPCTFDWGGHKFV